MFIERKDLQILDIMEQMLLNIDWQAVKMKIGDFLLSIIYSDFNLFDRTVEFYYEHKELSNAIIVVILIAVFVAMVCSKYKKLKNAPHFAI